MDTIIYMSYTSQNLEKTVKSVKPFAVPSPECTYQMREYRIQDYRLINLGVQEKVPCEDEVDSAAKRFYFRRQLAGCYRRKKTARLLEKSRAGMKEVLHQELLSKLSDRDEVFLCYDSSVPPHSWVRELLPFHEFEDYGRESWVRRLLTEAWNPHFLILGDSPCMKDLLWELAPRMKSLCWIAPDLGAEEELEDLAEDFYQEMGLAIRLQFLPQGTTYGQLSIEDNLFREPLNILDFTEGKFIPRFSPPKGSLWLDIASNTEKERRIQARRLPCQLISLRKRWKNPASLDTVTQNGYNTIVN